MQRLYIPVGLAIKSYPIPAITAKTSYWPLPLCSGWIGSFVPITWDENKTMISSSRLVISATAKQDPMDMWVKFNGTKLRRFLWEEGAKGKQSDVIDVSIINGSNLLEVYACKMYPWLGVASIDVKAHIEITYTGEDPQSKTWWESLREWLEANWPYLAIGAGMLIIGGVTYSYLARPRTGLVSFHPEPEQDASDY